MATTKPKPKKKPAEPYAKKHGLVSLSVPLTPALRQRLKAAAVNSRSSADHVRMLIETYC